MFTGIVSDIGTVVAITPRAADLRRLTFSCSYDRAGIADGASIACSGTCLTVVAAGVEHGRTWFSVDAAAETLRLTTVGRWTVGTRVNLERALKIGDELGGHLVTGHVDGLAELIARRDLGRDNGDRDSGDRGSGDRGSGDRGSGEMVRMTFRAPSALARFIATKGSVTLAGVSLTVNEVAGDTFSVLLIPHTLQVTTLGDLAVGDPVNLEVDLMARYAARLSEAV